MSARIVVRRLRTAASLSRRQFASSASRLRISSNEPSNKRTGIRVSTLFGSLVAVGAATAGYGIYQFYNTLTMWPPQVRSDLRSGLKAKQQGDLALSSQYIQRAYDTALSLPPSQLSTDASKANLMTTGIAITLAGVLEENSKAADAYQVYLGAFSRLDSTHPSSSNERWRLTALAYKLGEMASDYDFPNSREEEEKWLTYAVNEALKLSAQGLNSDEGSLLSKLELPSWNGVGDEALGVAGPVQALGAYYSKIGNFEYAMPLYLHAISTLTPPDKPASIENRCRSAELMNNLSSIILQATPEPTSTEKLAQSEAWARKALAVANAALADCPPVKGKEGSVGKSDGCAVAKAVILYNLGYIREQSDDVDEALKLYGDAKEQARLLGLKDGVRMAQRGASRVASLSKPPQPTSKEG